ncbi:hypothetical protein CCUS01_10975, partial [Colletotrichum cuscutae]
AQVHHCIRTNRRPTDELEAAGLSSLENALFHPRMRSWWRAKAFVLIKPQQESPPRDQTTTVQRAESAPGSGPAEDSRGIGHSGLSTGGGVNYALSLSIADLELVTCGIPHWLGCRKQRLKSRAIEMWLVLPQICFFPLQATTRPDPQRLARRPPTCHTCNLQLKSRPHHGLLPEIFSHEVGKTLCTSYSPGVIPLTGSLGDGSSCLAHLPAGNDGISRKDVKDGVTSAQMTTSSGIHFAEIR